jgi:hypothetical protein
MEDAALEIARLRAALAASEARAASAQADLAQVRAVVTTSEAMISHLKLEIAKLRREQYGQSSERRARLSDQMELQLEELEADATEDEIAAERLAAKIANVSAFERRCPARKPFPEHLPRESLIVEAPSLSRLAVLDARRWSAPTVNEQTWRPCRRYETSAAGLGSETLLMIGATAVIGVLDYALRGDNQGETRIASPKSVPKEQCRCLTRMFSIASPVVPEI